MFQFLKLTSFLVWRQLSNLFLTRNRHKIFIESESSAKAYQEPPQTSLNREICLNYFCKAACPGSGGNAERKSTHRWREGWQYLHCSQKHCYMRMVPYCGYRVRTSYVLYSFFIFSLLWSYYVTDMIRNWNWVYWS